MLVENHNNSSARAPQGQSDSEHKLSGPQTILLIDDDADQIFLIKHVLKSAGYKVKTALSGEEGLELLGVGNISLVITDVMMPGISGLKVSDIIKHSSHLSDIPVILLTALSDDIETHIFEEGGADMLCMKADFLQHLIPQIQFLLDEI